MGYIQKYAEGAWYDNEWDFRDRMLETTVALINAK